MKSLSILIILVACILQGPTFARPPVGLVETPKGQNAALLVGVPDDLEGIDLDMKMMGELLALPSYQFSPTTLWDKEGTATNVAETLRTLSAGLADEGTLLFYYSGHGDPEYLNLYDKPLHIKTLRDAIEEGRKGRDPFARLVLLFDSCYSGSLVDPIVPQLGIPQRLLHLQAIGHQVDLLAADFSRSSLARKLLIFASSQADELSQPTEEGSEFTLALIRAFRELAPKKGTIGQWIKRTIRYTEDHTPVARAVPDNLLTEPLL